MINRSSRSNCIVDSVQAQREMLVSWDTGEVVSSIPEAIATAWHNLITYRTLCLRWSRFSSPVA